VDLRLDRAPRRGLLEHSRHRLRRVGPHP
jgi:hypothetical protein